MIDVGAGVIDNDYRGEIKVILFNLSSEDYIVKVGDRIAQLIIEYFIPAVLKCVDELDQTERNDNGFGSSGI